MLKGERLMLFTDVSDRVPDTPRVRNLRPTNQQASKNDHTTISFSFTISPRSEWSRRSDSFCVFRLLSLQLSSRSFLKDGRFLLSYLTYYYSYYYPPV